MVVRFSPQARDYYLWLNKRDDSSHRRLLRAVNIKLRYISDDPSSDEVKGTTYATRRDGSRLSRVDVDDWAIVWHPIRNKQIQWIDYVGPSAALDYTPLRYTTGPDR